MFHVHAKQMAKLLLQVLYILSLVLSEVEATIAPTVFEIRTNNPVQNNS